MRTQTLLRDRRIGIILATGGEAMVRAAYSSGNPALGVGPGNGPSFIEHSADIPLAVKRIFDSKTFPRAFPPQSPRLPQPLPRSFLPESI